jgi:hypothetical protein
MGAPKGNKYALGNEGGAPSKYKRSFVKQAQKLAELGATDVEVAEFFDINIATVYRWKHTYKEFCDALRVGKEKADDRVEASLYKKAVGYTFESEKIFNNQGEIVRASTTEFVQPDTSSAIFWLKNRRPDDWRDRVDYEHSGSVDLKFSDKLRSRVSQAKKKKKAAPDT